MPRSIFAITILLFAGSLQAQPKTIESDPNLQRLFRKFDPVKLREAIAFPVSHVKVGVKMDSSDKKDESLPIAVIEKKLRGDDRDAEWLLKLGHALSEAKSDRAKDAYERAAALFRKRIEREPKSGKHHLDLIEALQGLEKPAEVFALARKCVEVEPKNDLAWAALGNGYWHEFFKLLGGNTEEVKFQFHTDKPPQLPRPLSAAEKDYVRKLLGYIKRCEDERSKHATDDIGSIVHSALMSAHWHMFDRYFQTGQWNVDAGAFAQFIGQRTVTALAKHGREKNDVASLGFAVFMQAMACRQESKDPNWSYNKLTALQKQTMAELLDPLEKLCGDKDHEKAAKATIFLATLSLMVEGDLKKGKHYAERALEMAPRESGVVDFNVIVKKAIEADVEQFLVDHVARHPSARAWEHLATLHFRKKRFAEAERCLNECEKIDARSPVLALARAALLLKRDEASLKDAGKVIDAIETRLEEDPTKKGLFMVEEVPSFKDSYRYLRALHTALSGKWEQGRDELFKLREEEILVEAIDQALEAFPPRMIILPSQGLQSPPGLTPKKSN